MANYKVGVELRLLDRYVKPMAAAARSTDLLGRSVNRTGQTGAAALGRVRVAAAGVNDVVGRTAGQARRASTDLTRTGRTGAAALGRVRTAAGSAGDLVGRTGGQARRLTGDLTRTGRTGAAALGKVRTAAGGVNDVVGRTAGQMRRAGRSSRRMADDVVGSTKRLKRAVNDLLGRYRALNRESGGKGGMFSRATGGAGRMVAAAGGGYVVSQAVRTEAGLEDRYIDLASQAKLTRDEQTGMRQRIEVAATEGGTTRDRLLEATAREFELTGELGPAMADLADTARALRAAPALGARDVGTVRAKLGGGGFDTESVAGDLFRIIAAAEAGSLSAAGIAEHGAQPMAAFTETWGGRDVSSFLTTAQRIMPGFGDAATAMTALRGMIATIASNRGAGGGVDRPN